MQIMTLRNIMTFVVIQFAAFFISSGNPLLFRVLKRYDMTEGASHKAFGVIDFGNLLLFIIDLKVS